VWLQVEMVMKSLIATDAQLLLLLLLLLLGVAVLMMACAPSRHRVAYVMQVRPTCPRNS